MATAYSRVTVVNGTRRVDLALPNAAPLADVVPQLLRFCAPAEQPSQPASWTVGRVGGPNIDLTNTLAGAGVLDGDVLELRSAQAPKRPAYVTDVRDTTEDITDATGGQWRTRTTLGFILLSAAAAAAAAMLLPFVRLPGAWSSMLPAVLVAALAITGGWWSTSRTHPAVPAALVATGGLYAGLVGWLAASWAGWSQATVIVVGMCFVLAAVAIARVLTPMATVHLAVASVITAAAAVTAVAAWVWAPLTYGRVAGVLAVLVIGVLPRASMAAGGLASADYRVRRSGLITESELAERVRQSSLLLFGGLLGLAVVAALAGVQLAYAPGLSDRLLGATVGVLLLLRSRVFSRILHMAPLRVAAVVVLATHAVRLGSTPEVRPWFLVALCVVAAGLAALAVAPLSDITRARIKRILDWTEMVLVVVMIVLVASSVGLYDMVAALMRS